MSSIYVSKKLTIIFFIQAPSYGDIRLTIEELPNPVKLHQSINLVCRITNTRYILPDYINFGNNEF